MLHDAGDEDVAVVIADRIDIDFGGAVEEAVDQHRIVAGDAEQLAGFHLLLQFALRPTPPPCRGRPAHRRGAGSPDSRCPWPPRRFLPPSWRCRCAAASDSARSAASGSACGLRPGRWRRRWCPGSARLHRASALASFSGVWPPNCTITPASVPFACSLATISSTSSSGQRLEIEPVGGVVIGRDGFRIAVDHDGLIALRRQREGGMAAAIVELDALADAVGPAAQDDDLLARRWDCFRIPAVPPTGVS